MQTKQTTYYCALHLGRVLKDYCSPTDPERNVISEMMQLLKTRWRDVWPAISQRSLSFVTMIIIIIIIT